MVPISMTAAVGNCTANAVLGRSSVILPKLLITILPKTITPAAKPKPVMSNNKVRLIPSPTPTTIPTALEQSFPALAKAVIHMIIKIM